MEKTTSPFQGTTSDSHSKYASNREQNRGVISKSILLIFASITLLF